MGLFRYLKLPKIYLIEHHTGAGLALETGVIYPGEILTIACSAPVLMTREEQAAFYPTVSEEWSKPRKDGSQFMTTWNMMKDYVIGDLGMKDHEMHNALREWKARPQAYGVLSKQDKLTYFKQIICPLLPVCAETSTLGPYVQYCKELVIGVSHPSK